MIKVSQFKMKIGHTEEALVKKLLHLLHIDAESLISYRIEKQSLDARKKPNLYYVYTIHVSIKKEDAVLKAMKNKKMSEQVSLCTNKGYSFPAEGTMPLADRPVVVGSGPAGLFCTYFLAQNGYRPILIEQGAPVEEREKEVQEFWEKGVLNPFSNVQFGEGGAGTFSDGKLNTLVKDVGGRMRKVLELFVENGAPSEILYMSKPHIGTDILVQVVKQIRAKIIGWGGEVCFHTKFTNLELGKDTNCLQGVWIKKLGTTEAKEEFIKTTILVLAPGHSARDTFEMLYEKQIPMESKSFAVGARIEHPQQRINKSQYGVEESRELGAASYKLAEKLQDGRGVYSFCMCPGGYVVNASSEEGRLAINGMSYHARDSRHANSAIVVTVTAEDFGDTHPLAGVAFQRKLEEAAWTVGKGKIPVQRFGEFAGRPMEQECTELPCMKGEYQFADLREIFPEAIRKSLIEGIEKFNAKISGFSSPDALISAVESRTSSPIRIVRNETCESSIRGVYPCGEGAGYAGGITSAAVDGIKIAEKIREKYSAFDK